MFNKIRDLLPQPIHTEVHEFEEIVKKPESENVGQGPSSKKISQEDWNEPIIDILSQGRAESQKNEPIIDILNNARAEQQIGAQAQRAMLESRLIEELNKTQYPAGILGKGSTGKEVLNLQKELNEWRVANGQTPIQADGIFGPKTEEAVKEFQNVTGLKTDGLAGPNTKARLNLENNPDFKNLNPNIQDEIRKQLNNYQNDPSSRSWLIDLVSQYTFSGLTEQQQRNVLDAAMTTTENGMNNISSVDGIFHSSVFAEMTPIEKDHVINIMSRLADDPEKLSQLDMLLHDGNFLTSSKEEQQAQLQQFD
jgi:Putative peptidoglycan binding domain